MQEKLAATTTIQKERVSKAGNFMYGEIDEVNIWEGCKNVQKCRGQNLHGNFT